MKMLKSMIKGYKKRAKIVFDKKSSISLLSLAIVTKSLPLVWLIGDAVLSWKLYQKQNQQEHALRWARLGIGLTWFFGALNPVVAGFLLVVDGLYSIVRYRYYHVTKNIIEDVPRMARVGVGLMIMAAIPATLPALGLGLF